jgi:O-antigen biosynthesis protein WbqP
MLQHLTETPARPGRAHDVRCMEESIRAQAGGFHAKQTFDLTLSLLLLPFLSFVMAMIAFAVKLTSKGPVLYWSDRVGRKNRIFRMPKFRTMNVHTPEVATHLLRDPKVHLTVIGPFLRKTSLDELPQLYSILKGDLSFVGPRPALHNQDDLVALRTERGIHELVPGLTGWAQVNGRDDLPIPVKVEYDCEYLRKRTLLFDMRILLRTIVQVLRGHGVTH